MTERDAMGMSILQKGILCPFCFETFRFRDAWFRCRNPNPTECPLELDKPYSDHVGRPHTLSKAFPPPRADFWGRNNHKATCPQCGTSTTIRLCKHCHSRLPSQIENVDSKILAVIGGISSGKSHYIATLVQQLTSVLGPSMRIRVMPIGDSTRKNYEKYYREPVYQNRLVLPQTQSAKNNPVVREPLIYRLEFPQRWFGVPVVNLVLFDAAGEDVQDENTLALYNKYMIHAAGIIFLISPSQVPAICEQIRIARDGEPFEHALSRVVELFESEGRLPAGRQIGVPTAFVLSKSDMLAGIVDKSCAFLQDVPHSGTYDPREAEMVHEEIKGYLAAWGADSLMSIGEKFTRHSFFAVSALGCKPENNTIPRIDPIRCGDPLLWVLHQIGCERFGWGSVGRLLGLATRFPVWLIAVYVTLLAVAALVSPMVAGIASVVALIVGVALAISKREWTPAVMALGCAVATLVGMLLGSHFRAVPERPATGIPKEVATIVPKPPQPASGGTADIEKGDRFVPTPTVKLDVKVESPPPLSVPGWPFDAAEAARRQQEAATTMSLPKEQTIRLGSNAVLQMVLIPPGSFLMGSSPAEKSPGQGRDQWPQHEVTISQPFYMGVYEVTQEQWRAVMVTSPWREWSRRNREQVDTEIAEWKAKHSGATPSWIADQRREQPDAPNHAANCVSWNDASAFCTAASGKLKKNLRLPTEAEWEYACRAGSAGQFCYGDDPEFHELDQYAWHGAWSEGRRDSRPASNRLGEYAHPVGRKKPNAWGLYDMHGNVWEWCSDWYDKSYYQESPAVDPQGPSRGIWRVMRGGSCFDGMLGCRSAFRMHVSPGDTAYAYGFRVVIPAQKDNAASHTAAGKVTANRGPPPPVELNKIEGHWQWSNRQDVEITEGRVKLDGREWGTARWSAPGQFELWNSQEQLSQTLHLSRDGEWLIGRTPKGLRVWGRRSSDPLDPTPQVRFLGKVLDCDDGGHGLFVDLGSRNGLKTGSLVNVYLSAHPVTDERGKAIGLLKLFAKVVRLDTWTADVELMARPEVVAVQDDKVELLESDRADRVPAPFKPRVPPRP